MKPTKTNLLIIVLVTIALWQIIAYLEQHRIPTVCEECGATLVPFSEKYPDILDCPRCSYQVDIDYSP